ncbi:MAG: hypothetical protein F4Y00_06815 [Bacteroidetes bacterium SB0662_bin_6]|nr:hypothetical protein [Bacteroidetes bacterium SB0668_bin_1]MYE04663.1 hypothetical protein [Bacteroidetes bacterium SB0662_bin_6]
MTAHKPPSSDPVRDALEPLEEDERSELTATWATVRDDSTWPGIDANRRDRIGAFLSAHARAGSREIREERIPLRPLLRLVRRRWVVLSATAAAVVGIVAIGLALRYGCSVRSYSSGDGTVSYSWECEDGPNQWIYFYQTGPTG